MMGGKRAMHVSKNLNANINMLISIALIITNIEISQNNPSYPIHRCLLYCYLFHGLVWVPYIIGWCLSENRVQNVPRSLLTAKTHTGFGFTRREKASFFLS